MYQILLIDDDFELGELLQEYLAMEGYELTVCHDGESGLAAALTGKHDLVLLDVMLPKMNGFDATGIIRELSKDVQIVIQSSFVEFGENDEAIKAGANYFITKPINKNRLRVIIDEVCKKKYLKY
mgnify:CR=1 FL=1